jgi:hypothetical protein
MLQKKGRLLAVTNVVESQAFQSVEAEFQAVRLVWSGLVWPDDGGSTDL